MNASTAHEFRWPAGDGGADTPTVLLNVGATLDNAARSGVQRVVVRLARHLPRVCRVELVRFDRLEGHLRFLDRSEFDRLFGRGAWPTGLTPRPEARRTAYDFVDLLDDPEATWFLEADVPQHGRDGLELFARTLTQCREYGVRTAVVFYDLIPLHNPAYAADRDVHLRYLAEIERADLILPISRYSGQALEGLQATVPGAPVFARIVPTPLAEADASIADATDGDEAGRSLVLLVGTVEPRKRQVEFLRAFAAARRRSPAVARLKIIVAGSLHPAVARDFLDLAERTPGVEYLRYAPDDRLTELRAQAAFTAFVSDDEGFGLPIVESLAAGAPCLCASFGAMAEAAEGGGCLTVDVRDPAALESAIVRLAEDTGLRTRLREEIAARRLRTWADYAVQVVQALSSQPAMAPGSASIRVVERPSDVGAADAAWREAAAADVLQFPTAAVRDGFIAEAGRRDTPVLLPSRIVLAEGSEPSAAALAASDRLARHRGRLSRVAAAERRYAAARRAFAGQSREAQVFLRVVITTYNRRAFVLENVRWLLERVVNRPGVELMVVDNASTDDTAAALDKAFGGRLRVVVNPANTGMLGNIRVCSQLAGAEYVWVTGDDDFIVPEQFEAVLTGLKAVAGVPLAALNFAVYHRERLRRRDSASSLIREGRPLATAPVESGLQPVTRIAAQHDNLFTAIYGLIWRADVLAAAYDHVFAGPAFADLTESIPCTQTILGSFAACDAYWRAEPAVAGNAHNSWSRHRPRWHGKLMLDALSLARDGGVDPERLWPWARLHGDLFDQARDEAMRQGVGLNLDEPGVLDPAWPMLRRRLAMDGAA